MLAKNTGPPILAHNAQIAATSGVLPASTKRNMCVEREGREEELELYPLKVKELSEV